MRACYGQIDIRTIRFLYQSPQVLQQVADDRQQALKVGQQLHLKSLVKNH